METRMKDSVNKWTWRKNVHVTVQIGKGVFSNIMKMITASSGFLYLLLSSLELTLFNLQSKKTFP